METWGHWGSGGLWNNGPPGAPGRDPLTHADKPLGEWNKFHITMRGNEVTVILNEELVVDQAPLINYWDRKTPLEERNPFPFVGLFSCRLMVVRFVGGIFSSKN